MSKSPPNTNPDSLLKLTDLCVMCGMCIPNCPTYQSHGMESESPRGRIALIQSYLRGQLHDIDHMKTHLQHCTGCLNCESICPSRVPYAEIYHTAAAQLFQTGKKPRRWLRFLLRLMARPGGLNRLTGLFKLLSRLPDYQYLVHGMSTTEPCSQSVSSVPGQSDIYLFVGCMEQALDATTLKHATDLLQACGYRVIAPLNQACCGSLHQHLGDSTTARQLAATSNTLFSQDIPVIFANAGCGAQLRQNLPEGKATDLLGFLSQALKSSRLRFIPREQEVSLHTSCSRRNKMSGSSDDLAQLLSIIPDLKTRPITSKPYCCGAGAAHRLSDPQQTAAIRQPLVEQLISTGEKLLVSDNMNCTLNFREALSDTDIRVVHPVTLLWQQLERTSSSCDI